jgi:hypothetical protein
MTRPRSPAGARRLGQAEWAMRLALEQAAAAEARGEVPVGAVVLRADATLEQGSGGCLPRGTTSPSPRTEPTAPTPRRWPCARPARRLGN